MKSAECRDSKKKMACVTKERQPRVCLDSLRAYVTPNQTSIKKKIVS